MWFVESYTVHFFQPLRVKTQSGAPSKVFCTHLIVVEVVLSLIANTSLVQCSVMEEGHPAGIAEGMARSH